VVPSPSPAGVSAPLAPVLRERLERHLESGLELPLLPDIAARVLAACEDEHSDARTLEPLIERDPALAAHLLRVANSAAHGTREALVSLRQAVSRLGLGAIRGIVLAVSLQSRVFRAPGHEAHLKAVWKHSALSAAFAREIARALRRNVEGAFLCGLLHDVGRPVALQAALAALSGPGQPLPAQALAAAEGEFHAALGARLVSGWKLAPWTAVAVARHHAAPHELEGEYQEEAALTQLAHLTAHWASGPEPLPEHFQPPAALLELLNLYPEDVEALLATRARALEFAELLA
jgi:putative nucleotidyltransferase with HDIG domain